MKKNTSLTIKLIITCILGVLGIIYIMAKPPVGEISVYKKEPMAKPYSFSKNAKNSKSSNTGAAGDSDAISLTGKAGKYDESRIGK